MPRWRLIWFQEMRRAAKTGQGSIGCLFRDHRMFVALARLKKQDAGGWGRR
jgi:hypothetical protein